MDDPNRASTQNTEIKIITLFALGFLLWSAVFIYRTSFIAIDGKRYFCLFDDAMISMRYAWNLSSGAGLVWNTGEHVQGYTNLLMTLLMSLTTLIFDKSIAVLAIQILGVGLMLAIGYAMIRIADYIFRDGEIDPSQQKLIRILVFIFALSYYPLTYWTETGMETGLLTTLLIFGILYAFRFLYNTKARDLFTTAICLGLAFLTRSDSLIFAVLIWIYMLWEIKKKKIKVQVSISFFSAVILYLIFIIGQFLFQYLYYGEFLPNTYSLKLTGMSLPDRLSSGLVFILPFLVQVSFILLPAILDIFMRYRKEKSLLLALFLSSVGYQIYVGGDAWNYWRMISPTMPLLGILFIGFVRFSIRSQAEKTRLLKRYGPDTQVILIVLIGLLVVNAYFLPEALFLDRPFYVSANEHNVNIAVALREVTTPEATVGILWAGAIPYFAERRGIDFLGKSDRYIAHLAADLSGKVSANGVKSLPGHNKYDLNYSIKHLRPTYVQSFKWGTQDLTTWAVSNYVSVEYKGVSLYLIKNSTEVHWDKIGSP